MSANEMGRKPALNERQVAELKRRAGQREKNARLAREFGISRETLSRFEGLTSGSADENRCRLRAMLGGNPEGPAR